MLVQHQRHYVDLLKLFENYWNAQFLKGLDAICKLLFFSYEKHNILLIIWMKLESGRLNEKVCEDLKILFRADASIQQGTGHIMRCLVMADELRKGVMNKVGVTSFRQSDYLDNQLNRIALLEIVKIVEDFIYVINPTIIYTHFEGDLNIDHRICSSAVSTACRPLPETDYVQIFAFEVASSTE